MAKPLRPKRGTTAKNDAFVGLASEITVDTEKHSIRVHDGVTAGGHALATDADLATVRATADAALPKSGGAMTGNISVPSNFNMSATSNDGRIAFFGGAGYSYGSVLELSAGGREGASGQFMLSARDGQGATKSLIGKPDGTLTWGGKEVERVNSSGDGYIRYESGLQICWGSYQVSSGTQVSEVVFPVPFLSKSSYVPNANSLTKGNINLICVRDANSANGEKMTVQAYLQGNTTAPTTNYYVAWSARGKWK